MSGIIYFTFATVAVVGLFAAECCMIAGFGPAGLLLAISAAGVIGSLLTT